MKGIKELEDCEPAQKQAEGSRSRRRREREETYGKGGEISRDVPHKGIGPG